MLWHTCTHTILCNNHRTGTNRRTVNTGAESREHQGNYNVT